MQLNRIKALIFYNNLASSSTRVASINPCPSSARTTRSTRVAGGSAILSWLRQGRRSAGSASRRANGRLTMRNQHSHALAVHVSKSSTQTVCNAGTASIDGQLLHSPSSSNHAAFQPRCLALFRRAVGTDERSGLFDVIAVASRNAAGNHYDLGRAFCGSCRRAVLFSWFECGVRGWSRITDAAVR